MKLNARTGAARRTSRIIDIGRRAKDAIAWPFRPIYVVEKLAYNEGTITVAARPSPLRRLIARLTRTKEK